MEGGTGTHTFVYNFITRELEWDLDLKQRLASVTISQNSRYLLVHTVTGEAKIYDLDTRELLRDLETHVKASKFVIRASYGGANESFVVTGSEGTSELSSVDSCTNPRQMVTSLSGTRKAVSKLRSLKLTMDAATQSHGTLPTHPCLHPPATTRKSECKSQGVMFCLQLPRY